VAKKERIRDRRPYRDPAPSASARSPAADRRRDRRATRGADRGGLPLLPLTLGGLAIGVLLVAFLAFQGNAGAPATGPLETPDASYPAENADMTLGSASAPVTLDEWADFQCPGCRAYTRQIEPRVIDTYVKTGKVRIVFHDFPFIQPVQQSITAATAARCAGRQQHFWVYHGYLYANQGREGSGWVTTALLDQIATAAGLDRAAFDACLGDTSVQQQIVASKNTGVQQGVSSTPTLYLNGQTIEGPNNTIPSFDLLRATIDQLLSGA
jgi:protein-disulfide isomerase